MHDSESDIFYNKVTSDKSILEANMPLQKWVSNNQTFNLPYRLDIPVTQNVLSVNL